ncbi:hypothetical protein DFH06DRAFT_1180186 [Mycena polygramma]|nr:hypothetical protein DFH06DRAFT_1180186 [Mycena polygramma]
MGLGMTGTRMALVRRWTSPWALLTWGWTLPSVWPTLRPLLARPCPRLRLCRRRTLRPPPPPNQPLNQALPLRLNPPPLHNQLRPQLQRLNRRRRRRLDQLPPPLQRLNRRRLQPRPPAAQSQI